MGKGAEKLGATLMGSFLRKLSVAPERPDVLILYNAGVKLAAVKSAVLDALETLYHKKVDIVACGTCVTYFKLNGKIAVGRISDMAEIAGIITRAKQVITI